MKRLLALAALAAVVATPALAALKIGATAPDFATPAFQGGKETTFSLAKALKKGPVVLYFFPAAYTGGCNIEAHAFAEAADQFHAAGATVIGVTAGNLDRLKEFSADTERCSGKFPVAGDPTLKIAKSYESTLALRPGWSDRTSYVISPQGKVLLSFSDLKPDDHVSKTLGAVQAWKASHK